MSSTRTHSIRNGSLAQGQWFQLDAGQSKSVAYSAETLIGVEMNVDKFNQVSESDESNNHCAKYFSKLKRVFDVDAALIRVK